MIIEMFRLKNFYHLENILDDFKFVFLATYSYPVFIPLDDLHLIFDNKLDSWTYFFILIFLSISNWIFAGYIDSQNQVWNRQKIKFKNQFRELGISKVKINMGIGKHRSLGCESKRNVSNSAWYFVFKIILTY